MSLASGIVEDRIPAYEQASGDVLRALDPTEHNMERLNARARGSARVYHTLLLEGPLSREALERAVDTLTDRHPLLRVRIVRGADGALHFAPTRGERKDGTARVPVSYVECHDLSSWPALVEADMNAGAIASDRGPLFAFAVIGPPGLGDGASGRRVLVMVGHHGASDGVSSVALLHELLTELAQPQPVARRGDLPPRDPFCLDVAVPELAEVEAQVRSALDRHDRTELRSLHDRLERLEQHLLAEKDGEGRLPVALKRVHGCLTSMASELFPAGGVVPEVALDPGATRYERARTALLHRTLDAAATRAVRAAGKDRGLTMHGAVAAAVLVALSAERASDIGFVASAEWLALASAVSLRPRFAPPISSHDLRMAVDILVSRVPVEPGARFWDLARRVGEDITRSVANGRALSSSFRTLPRSFEETPPGIALPVLSNLGKAELKLRYGALEVLELYAAMATHGSFQLGMLFVTFEERLSMSFYSETPTISRASLDRFATRVRDTLTAVASGDDPVVPA